MVQIFIGVEPVNIMSLQCSGMNTNPGTGVDRNFFSSVRNFFSSITTSTTNNNTLNYSIHTGAWGIPYATMGLVTVVAGTLTYVTYSDYISDTGDDEAGDDSKASGESETNDDSETGDDSEASDESAKSSSPFGLGVFGSQPADEVAEESTSPKSEDVMALNEQKESSPKKEDLEKNDEEDIPKTDESEKKKDAPDEEKYTLGGKTRGNRKKYLKRKTSKRKIRR